MTFMDIEKVTIKDMISGHYRDNRQTIVIQFPQDNSIRQIHVTPEELLELQTAIDEYYSEK